MMIRFILVFLFSVIALLAVTQFKTSRALGMFLLLVCGLAIATVLHEEMSTRLAQFVGIGRGADLVLYLWIPVSMLMQLLQYLYCKRLEASVTGLTRHVALSSPRMPPAPVGKDSRVG